MIHCFYPKTLNLSDHAISTLEKHYTLTEYDTSQDISDDAEVIIGNPPKSLPSSLKWVQLIAAGYDSIDIQSLKNKNVQLTNGSGTTSAAIAEYVIAAILYSYKALGAYTRQHDKSEWNPLTSGKELSGSNIAILGTGHIGKDIARRLKPFNVSIHGYNSNGRDVEYFDTVSKLNDFDHLASTFDCVILALPLNEHTRYFFNKHRLTSLKKTCTLINVGRGPVIELQALESIVDDTLSFVILDVVENEPLLITSKLWKHEKVLITPHTSYMSQHRIANIEKLLVTNLLSYAHGEKLQNIIL